MKTPNYDNWNIRRKMLILAIIPLALITCLLSGYFIWSSQAAVRDLFIQEGRDTSRYLSKVTEFQMFSGDTESLRAFGTLVLTESDIETVAFLDSDGKVLVKVGTGNVSIRQESAITRHGAIWLFQQPVIYSALEVDDFPIADESLDDTNTEEQVLGWVQLSINEKLLLSKQRAILVTGIIIALVGLTLAILMAVRLGRRITKPLFQLTNTVEQLESGALSSRAPNLKGYEFQVLASGMNRMAERIEHVNEELQQRVGEATRELQKTLNNLEQQNQELEHTRTELIAADQAKDEFLARMSHELRTPLTSILGYSELLEELGMSKQQQEFNHIIRQSSDLLLSAINDILDFTKLRSNAIELESLPFDLHNCMEDVVAMHAHGAFEKDLELVLLIDSDVPRQVSGDELRLRQIINNLISNAIKFTLQGEVIVSVSTGSAKSGTLSLEILVKDSGIGIKEGDIEHLFEEFSQADASITRRFGGSGLGLVIVKRLARLMDGDVNLASTAGKGTEARCHLQLAIEVDKSSRKLAANPINLLIYDSHPWSLRALRNLALNTTSKIVAVKTRSDLMQKLCDQSLSYDAILVGLNRSELEKLQLIDLINNIRSQTDKPILLAGSTALLPIKQTQQWKKWQPIEFISKPARNSLLSERLSTLLFPSSYKQKPESALTEPASSSDNQLLKGANILVAEDNDFNRKLLLRLLQHTGANVIEAENGAAAVEAYHQVPIDIVLLDLNMPEMGGLEAAELIRQSQPADFFTSVIALTAAITENQHNDQKMQLFDAVLYKPIRQQDLVSELLKIWISPKHKNMRKTEGSYSTGLLINVSKEELNIEILRLTTKLKQAENPLDRDQIKLYSHQLLGVIDQEAFEIIAKSLSYLDTKSHSADKDELKDKLERCLELLAASFDD